MKRKIVPDLVRDQDLVLFAPEDTVREAAVGMAERHIGAVLVAQDGNLVGIFTERDLLTRVVAAKLDPDKVSLKEVMTPDPDTLLPDDIAVDALHRLAKAGYRHLPVQDQGKIIGIVSLRDLYACVKDSLESDLKQREAFIFDTGYGAS
jgi:CBS domain-containing protein